MLKYEAGDIPPPETLIVNFCSTGSDDLDQ